MSRYLVKIRIGDEHYELSWEEWEGRVRSGRVPPDALVCVEAVTGDHYVRAQQLELYRSLRNDAAIAWQGQFLSGPPPLLTALLVGVQIRIWWFARLPEVAESLVLDFTNWTAPALEDGQTWRMISMGFLHTELFHLVLNMLWLAYTGWNLERALGRRNLATLYVASVIGGSLLSMYGSPETPSLGASGGVFGLVAACVTFGFARPELLPDRARRVFGFAMAPYLVVMFASGLANDGTDNWSHLGGLLVGGSLALVLDPEPLQRRPSWNRRWRGAVALACTLAVVGLGVAGPRAIPLVDSVEASRASLPRHLRKQRRDLEVIEEVALRWEVPAGWKRGVTAVGSTGFLSPSPVGERAWAVKEERRAAPIDPEEIRVAWTNDLLRGWPSAVVGPLEPDVVGGHPGWRTRVALDADSTALLEWRFAVRGLWVLQELWQVDAARAERLAPLRDRLRRSVGWSDPVGLVEARATVARVPGSQSGRISLARALAEIGDADASLALWDALMDERGADPAIWMGALETARWYPTQVGDLDALWDAALARHGVPSLVLEVVVGLEAANRHQDARGLLQLAWVRDPGDTSIRKARAARRLPRGLDPVRHLPWEVLRDPLTGDARADDEVQALRSRPLTVAAARQAGEELTALQAALGARAVAGFADPAVGDPLAALLALKLGHTPDDLRGALEGLLEDARSLESDYPASWLPPDLAARLPRDLVGRVQAALDAQP